MADTWTHTANLGSLEAGVFSSDNDYKYTDQTDLGNSGHGGGWCGSGDKNLGVERGQGPPIEPEGHLLFGSNSGSLNCRTWHKGGKKKRAYRWMTRKPNSTLTGLYKRKADGSTTSNADVLVKGQPCPGAISATYTSALKPDRHIDTMLKCVYPKIDDTVLRAMSAAMEDGETMGARYDTWYAAATDYCNNPTTDPTLKINTKNETCAQTFANNGLAAAYCGTGDNMAAHPTICSVTDLTAPVYDQLGNAFCAANPENPWCGCYNVINKTCTANPMGSGCASLVASREIMAGQGMDTTVFDQKPQCNAPACAKTQGEVWKPATSPDTMTCQQNLNICTQNISQGVAQNAPVNASCSMSPADEAEAKANGSQDPVKMAAVEEAEPTIMERMKQLAILDEMDADAAADAAAGAPVEKKNDYTIIYIIVALLLLCCCAGIAVVATK